MTDRFADQGRREGFQGPISADTLAAPVQLEVTTPKEMAQDIKRVARFFKAIYVASQQLTRTGTTAPALIRAICLMPPRPASGDNERDRSGP